MMGDLVKLAQDKPVVDSHVMSVFLGVKHAELKRRIEVLIVENPTLRVEHHYKVFSKQNRTEIYLLYPRTYFMMLLGVPCDKAADTVTKIVCNLVEFCHKKGLGNVAMRSNVECFDFALDLCEKNNLKAEFNKILMKGISDE